MYFSIIKEKISDLRISLKLWKVIKTVIQQYYFVFKSAVKL